MLFGTHFGIRRSGLRWKIIAWSFVPTAIILTLVALVGFYAYQQVTESFAIGSSRELVRLSAGQLSAELADYGRILSSAARTSDFADPTPTARRLALKKARERLAIFDGGTLVLDSRGEIIAAEPERVDLLGQDWSEQAIYVRMVRSPGTVFGQITNREPNGLRVIIAAVPITGSQGELLGILAGMFRMGAASSSSFYGDIVKLRLATDATAYLVDGSGMVLYHTDSDRIGSDFSAQPVIALLAGDKSGAFRTRDVTARDIVAAYAPVPGTPWDLVIEQDWFKLLASGESYGQFLIVLLVLGLIIPAIVVTAGVSKITDPIAKLIDASQRVASGQFEAPIVVQTGDELEELGKQFNHMSAQLKESYAAVQAREERLSLAMKGTNDGYWDWDVRTNQTFFSPRWKSMLGYQDDEIENCFEAWRDLIHPDDLPGVTETLQAYLDGRSTVYELEHRLRHKDGSYRWVLTRGIALRDANGKAYRVAGSHTDITERKRTEEEIRQSELRFAQVFHANPLPISITSLRDGRYLDANDAWLRLYGYRREEIIGKTSLELNIWVHPEQRVPMVKQLEAMGSVRDYEHLERLKSGEERSVLVSSQVVTLNGEQYKISLVHDITERKRAEEEVRHSEKRFAQVFHTNPLPISITTLEDGRYVDANDAWLRLYGFQRAEVIGKTSLELNIWVHPEERMPMIRQLESAGSVRDFEHLARTKTGDVRDVLVSAEVIEFEDGRYNLSLVHDITERKRAEEEVRRQNAYLQALHQTALSVLGQLDLTELLQRIVERSVNLIGAAFGWVYLVTPNSDALELKVGTGPFRRHVGVHLARGEGVAGTIWETGEPLLVQDYAVFQPQSKHFEGEAIGSVLGVPLRWGTRVVGAFGLTRSLGNPPFRPDELEFMNRFAQLVSIALENASLHSSIQAELTERVRAQEALQDRLAFERLVTSISTEFINIDPEDFDAGIQKALAAIGEFTDSDRSYIFMFSDDGTRMTNSHEWCRGGIAPLKSLYQDQPVDILPWSVGKIKQLHVVHVPSVPKLPAEASAEREHCQGHADPTLSMILVPMVCRGQVTGFLGFDSVRSEKTWTQDSIALLRMVGEIFVNALDDKKAQQAIQLANLNLERRVQERTHELETLNSVAALVSRSLDLQEISADALDKTMLVLGMEMGIAYRLEENANEPDDCRYPCLVPLAARGVSSTLFDQFGCIPLRDRMPQLAVITEQPTVWRVVDHPLANIRRALEDEGVQVGITVPLLVKRELVGAIFLGTRSARVVTPEELALLAGMGQQVAMAVDNARLYKAEQDRLEEAERRRRVAEGLREIFAALNSQQSLDETLDYIVKHACQIIGSDAASLFHLQTDQGLLSIQASSGLDDEYACSFSFPLGKGGAGRALATRQPMSVPNAQAVVDQLSSLPGAEQDIEIVTLRMLIERGFHALLSVPLVVRNEDYGAITLYYRQPRQFGQEEIRLALTLADQAALAIESARLRDQAEQAAAIAERTRLARELHDSVTQSLYSVTLYAEAAARLLSAGNNATAAEHLRDLRDTSQEALREMRLLIFQLRPPALEKSGLAAALQARLEGVESRGGMVVDLQVEGQEQLPRAVQEELYHLAQEALNNVIKHARAQHVSVHLEFADDLTSLEICDDGRGFDLEAGKQGGGMGLRGMEERVQKIGGTLTIASAASQGTRVNIQVPTYKVQGGEE